MTDEERNEREPKAEEPENDVDEKDDEPDFELHGQWFDRPSE